MVEIEVSTIPDAEIDTATMQTLADEFGHIHNARVHIRPMTWANAWTELFSIASHGKGPDVSHIGGTWLSSLAMMNALRPFNRDEIEMLGGSTAFMSPTWSSTKLPDSEAVWAIPWTGYIYVICYRKDFLKQAGVDEARAFANSIAFRETILKLRQSGVNIPWLNATILPPYIDYVHTSASWIWDAGGSFLDPTGKHVVLDSPEAHAGLVAWLETYLAVSDPYKHLTIDAVANPFIEGQAAAVLTDIRTAASFLAAGVDKVVSENLGVVTLTNVPWCGGGSFVVWNHTRIQPQRERLAVAFVQFMASKENNLFWAKHAGSMPARMDALEEIYPVGHPLRGAIMLASRQGHPYPSVPVWRRIEYQIAQTLSEIVKNGNQDNSQSLDALVQAHIDPLVRRLNLALEG